MEETQAALKDAEKGREDTVSSIVFSNIKLTDQSERRKLLETLEELEGVSKGLKMELAAFGAADPVKYEKKARGIEVAKDAAVRWTGEPCFAGT